MIKEPMPFGLRIAIINRAFRKKMDDKASAMGLTSVQLRVLGAISLLEHSGEREVHQNDLERIERVTHPAMTRVIQKLEKKGFIKCLPGENDRRYKKIMCTEQSKDTHKMIVRQDEEVLEEMCKDFTEQEKADFLAMIDKILKNIRK